VSFRSSTLYKMIKAGVIQICFDKLLSEQHRHSINLDSIKLYINNPQQLYKLDLIARLQKLRVILPTCILLSSNQCLIDIQVLHNESNDTLARDGQRFLELLQMVNRSSNPTTDFLPVFDSVPSSLNSLLDIFVNLPSPHVDHRLSDWCENPDIYAFLTKDIDVRIPGMKTTLYMYQKVGLP
jgi:hypothetical protein